MTCTLFIVLPVHQLLLLYRLLAVVCKVTVWDTSDFAHFPVCCPLCMAAVQRLGCFFMALRRGIGCLKLSIIRIGEICYLSLRDFFQHICVSLFDQDNYLVIFLSFWCHISLLNTACCNSKTVDNQNLLWSILQHFARGHRKLPQNSLYSGQ